MNIHPANANFPGDPGGDIFITDDILIEAPAPGVPVFTSRTGRRWLLPNSACNTRNLPDAGQSGGACTVNSPVGTGTRSPQRKQATAATTGILRATGVTHPRGFVFLGTHFWVADEVKGLCRIDPLASGRCCADQLFQANPGFIPGQPAADAAGNLVYVPDINNTFNGIARLVFNPATQTLSQNGSAQPGTRTGGRSGCRPGESGDRTDGSLYWPHHRRTGHQDCCRRNRTQRSAAGCASTFLGLGVRSMVFNDTNLYMMENGLPDKDSLFQTGAVNQR